MNNLKENIVKLETLRNRLESVIQDKNNVYGLRIVLIDISLIISACTTKHFQNEILEDVRKIFNDIRSYERSLSDSKVYDVNKNSLILRNLDYVIEKVITFSND